MIAVVHAYSRRNAGDGLLVDLTLERLRRTHIGVEECEVFALDAPSFADLPRVHQVGVPGRGPSRQMVVSGAQLLATGAQVASRGRVSVGNLCSSLGRADAVIGIAGGYLRAGDVVSSLGTLLNHVPQLALASRSDVPSVYMPQSIGPLRGPVGMLVKRLLEKIDLLCVRDDVSLRELEEHPAVSRYPDLAVLHLAERFDGMDLFAGSTDAAVVLVGRDLGQKHDYNGRLVALAERLRPVTWAVQAGGHGRKSDRVFYRKLGVTETGRLAGVLGRDSGAVVVSVRLHGAIEALLRGIPAVHLSYQRKGWSAYADLGLEDFVHDARRFDPESVARQVEMLRRDPGDFWSRIGDRRARLLRASESLTSDVARTLSGS